MIIYEQEIFYTLERLLGTRQTYKKQTFISFGEIIRKPEDLSQSMEGEVIFKCEIRKDPGLNMQWELNRTNIYLYNKGHAEYSKNYHNNETYLVKIDEGKETLTFTLTVKKVVFLNGGTYTCKTVDDEASANLIVLGW